MPGGRPRTFDADEALEQAVQVFWRHGYEGASLVELTTAMGMNRPSLYAVFGSKEDLFQKAVRRYAEQDMAYARGALEKPTAFEVARSLLSDNVAALTRADRPAGCLTIQGGLACSRANSAVSEFLAASRLAGEKLLAERFASAVAEGDLPDEADPAALARYVMVVAEGQAVHAAAGATREQLEQSAEIALRAFVVTTEPRQNTFT